MVALLPECKNIWQDLLVIANHHVTTGMVAVNNKKCNHYWHHWRNFLWPTFDLYLRGLS